MGNQQHIRDAARVLMHAPKRFILLFYHADRREIRAKPLQQAPALMV